MGALDGTHIFLKVNKQQENSYIDRYRRHSINLMAICDSKGLFTYIFVGFPGSAHDSRVRKLGYIPKIKNQHPKNYLGNSFIICNY